MRVSEKDDLLGHKTQKDVLEQGEKAVTFCRNEILSSSKPSTTLETVKCRACRVQQRIFKRVTHEKPWKV